MFVDIKPVGRNEFVKADVYPHIDNPADAAVADRITVLRTNGTVRWNNTSWTPEEVLRYLSEMLAAFAKAFEIAKAG